MLMDIIYKESFASPKIYWFGDTIRFQTDNWWLRGDGNAGHFVQPVPMFWI